MTEPAQTSGQTVDLFELVRYLVAALVDHPEKVKIEEFEEDDGTVVFELTVAQEDLGKVIGRQGRTAKAIRTLLATAAQKNGERALLEILD